jgi:hypothetical protein
MIRSSYPLSAIVVVLSLTVLGACTVMVKEPAHASMSTTGVQSRHGARTSQPAEVSLASTTHASLPAAGARASQPAGAPPQASCSRRRGQPAGASGQSACDVHTGTRCYWMENTSGHFCWVPADWAATFEECYAMDSCDGGKGESNGGCYKWADSSQADRVRWPNQ